jgi:type I restriction enzyme S subunit
MSGQYQLPFLPPGWVSTTLGELITILRGVSYPQNAALENPLEDYVPILRANNIQESISLKNLVYVPSEYVRPEQFLQVGDIVVAASSGSRHLVGKAAQLQNNWRGSFGAFCYALRPLENINRKFVGFFLQTPKYRKRISELSSGININNLKQENILGIPCLLPPLAEQQRIVDEIEKQFSRLDVAVEMLQRVERNLEMLRTATLKAAVEGRLVPTEAALARTEGSDYEPANMLLKRILRERRARWEADQLAKLKEQGKKPKDNQWKDKYTEPSTPDMDNLPELPEGWIWATVEQLASFEANSITDGPFGSNLKTEHYTNEGPRVIRLQNIRDGIFNDVPAHISQEHFEKLSKHQVKANDIVIAALGEALPRACIVPTSVGDAIVKADCVRLEPNPNITSSKYLNISLNSKPTRNRTASIVHGVGRPRLNLGEIKSIALPLPPLPEQRRIIAEVERRISVIEELKTLVTNALRRATILRQKILRDAFAGKLVRQDPADEPARVLLERIRAEKAEREVEARQEGENGQEKRRGR